MPTRHRDETVLTVLRRTLARVTGRGGSPADDGFTLIEAVVSFVIFAIVAAAGTAALVTGIKGNNDTSDRIAATQLAQQENDRARTLPLASLTASPSVTTSATVGAKTYTVTRRLSYPNGTACPAPTADPGTSVHEVQVQVRVAVPGSSRSVEMDSVIAC